jgi:hypothetical protein
MKLAIHSKTGSGGFRKGTKKYSPLLGSFFSLPWRMRRRNHGVSRSNEKTQTARTLHKVDIRTASAVPACYGLAGRQTRATSASRGPRTARAFWKERTCQRETYKVRSRLRSEPCYGENQTRIIFQPRCCSVLRTDRLFYLLIQYVPHDVFDRM